MPRVCVERGHNTTVGRVFMGGSRDLESSPCSPVHCFVLHRTINGKFIWENYESAIPRIFKSCSCATFCIFCQIDSHCRCGQLYLKVGDLLGAPVTDFPIFPLDGFPFLPETLLLHWSILIPCE